MNAETRRPIPAAAGGEAQWRRVYRKIGEFLNTHRLAPSPENYALAYQLAVHGDTPAARAVIAATSDGVRLTQKEADRILVEHGGGASVGDPHESERLAAAARRQLEAFAAVVDRTRNEARDYGRDLAENAARLERSAGGAAIPDLLRIAGAMVERAAAAERKLAAAEEETHLLRQKLETVRQDALSDPLTRLPNRRAFDERWAELERERVPTSLAICDVDRFKAINDVHGHGVGDRVLRMVADVLETSCAGHMVARLGGEEFVMLFVGLGVERAAEIVDQAREELAGRRFRVRGTDAPIGRITFSAGVAGGRWDEACEPALKRADRLLYEAKSAGRNQVRREED
ncbi:MAG: diguanylate cyclase [Allosphingosinicella sp.]|uniref:GGDEF domain-containing protein n=1 Tax=Allosphingosinicella sp. TaxID=2823234 RepID=UPI0039422DE9